jgi:hypothetical protein
MLANKKTVGYRHAQNLLLPLGDDVAEEIYKGNLHTKMAD